MCGGSQADLVRLVLSVKPLCPFLQWLHGGSEGGRFEVGLRLF